MSKIDKKQEILKAALELFAEQGFHGAPMSKIAEKAGVAAGTVYCYFESRDILIHELFLEVKERINRFLYDRRIIEGTVRERFQTVISGLLRYFVTHPEDFRYLEQFHNSPYGVEYRRIRFFGSTGEEDRMKSLFTDGMKQKVIKDIPMVILFSLTLGPSFSIVSQRSYSRFHTA